MRENNRNSIEKCRKKLPQFTTMNVIDGQAGLMSYSSLTFYSLTIDNILNIIVLLILAGVTIATLTGDNGILTKTTEAKEQTEHSKVEEGMYLKQIEYEAKNYSEGEEKTFLEFLKDEGIIESTTLPSNINVEELLGQRISMGNGTESDVYKLEGREVTEGIEYIVNYYDDNNESTLVADLGLMEIYEDDNANYTFSHDRTTHELTLLKDGEKIDFVAAMSPKLENTITEETFEIDSFINGDGNIDIEEFYKANYYSMGEGTGSGSDQVDNLWFMVNITINGKNITSENLFDKFTRTDYSGSASGS